MKLKITITALVSATIAYQAFALGIGAWQNETPGGNILSHDHWDDITTFYSYKKGNEVKVDKIDSWYFYKDYVIGEYNNSQSYFIINENTSKLDTFQSKKGWIRFRDNNNINPKLWTRWYQNDWQFPLDELKFFLLIELIASLLITLPILLVCKNFQNKKYGFIVPCLKGFILAITFLWGLTIIYFILSNNPQSI